MPHEEHERVLVCIRMAEGEVDAPISVQSADHSQRWRYRSEWNGSSAFWSAPCHPLETCFIQPGFVDIYYAFSLVKDLQQRKSILLAKHQTALGVCPWLDLPHPVVPELHLPLHDMPDELGADRHVELLCDLVLQQSGTGDQSIFLEHLVGS